MVMQLSKLALTLEEIRHGDDAFEYWFGRELFPLLGYKNWRNFVPVIERAKQSCAETGTDVDNHFAGVRTMVGLGSGAQREVEDYIVTRYGCYLIAQNGDPRIPEIAFAQMYFALQTRKQELLEQSAEEIERIVSRRQLSETEKELVSEIYARGVVAATDIAAIKGSGDKMLFGGLNTSQMKRKLGVTNPKKPLSDVLPSITLKAKDLAAEMTTVNTRKKDLWGKGLIKMEHDDNNKSVRETLVSRGIYPESLPPAEDIKRVESRHRRQQKLLENKYRKKLPGNN